MTNKTRVFKKASIFIFASLIMFLSSCSTDSPDISEIDYLTDSTVESFQHKAIGKKACLEFVFPISIVFVDESVATADSYESLHSLVASWFQENGVEKSKDNRPQLLFPIQVLNEEGEIIDVENKEALYILKKECRGSKGCKGKKGKGFKCFSLVYPLTVNIDGTDTTFDDKESLMAALKAYKETAEEGAERPSLVFPVTVQYDDGSEAIANSREELKALKKACKEEN